MKSVICQQDGLECDLDTIAKKCRHIKDWEGRCSFRVEKEMPKGTATKKPENSKKSEPPELYPDLVTKCPRCGFKIIGGKS